ncbi:MAG: hypothetical protein ACJ75Z_13125 [Solirubrobacterales bacterium]
MSQGEKAETRAFGEAPPLWAARPAIAAVRATVAAIRLRAMAGQ